MASDLQRLPDNGYLEPATLKNGLLLHKPRCKTVKNDKSVKVVPYSKKSKQGNIQTESTNVKYVKTNIKKFRNQTNF